MNSPNLPEASAFKKRWQSEQKARRESGADCAFLYVHLEQDSGEPFYVGMGETVKRPWESARRSDYYKSVAEKHGVRTEIIATDLDWETAGWWEQRWISALRKAGYRLVNIADGGDGLSSFVAKEVNSRPDVRARTRVTIKKTWSQKTRADLLEHRRKIIVGRAKAKELRGDQGQSEWSIYFGALQKDVQNRPETVAKRSQSSVNRWSSMSDAQRKEMGQKMSEGRKRAKEAREAAAKLKELKD
jgi:hypothetical protein